MKWPTTVSFIDVSNPTPLNSLSFRAHTKFKSSGARDRRFNTLNIAFSDRKPRLDVKSAQKSAKLSNSNS